MTATMIMGILCVCGLSLLLALGGAKVEAEWDAADEEETALPLDPYTCRVITQAILDEADMDKDAGASSLLPGLLKALDIIYDIQDEET